MKEIHVDVYIHAPPDRVFDLVADHESFLRTNSGLSTRIVRPGNGHRDGLGCWREVRGGPGIRFLEEITGWDPPRSFEYQILECTLPVRHHGGKLRFIPRGEGTEVDWTSRFEIPVPVAHRALEALARRSFTETFSDLLLAVKARFDRA